jgi:ribosomal protein L12E/L44/L45/RPP1/RPP2
MEWIKIPTDDILYSNFDDKELIILIKYQALFCQLENEPTDAQIQRIFSKKEIKFLQNYKEIVKELCENQIKNVTKKRNKDKIHYQSKQSLSENSASGTKANRQLSAKAEKRREEKNKRNVKEKIFIPPTLEEVKAYVAEKNFKVNPKAFFDFFEAGNWVDSKGNKVLNWKQKLITWENKTKPKPEDDDDYNPWKVEWHDTPNGYLEY